MSGNSFNFSNFRFLKYLNSVFRNVRRDSLFVNIKYEHSTTLTKGHSLDTDV